MFNLYTSLFFSPAAGIKTTVVVYIYNTTSDSQKSLSAVSGAPFGEPTQV